MRGGEGGARRRRCGVSISNHRDEAEDADDEEARESHGEQDESTHRGVKFREEERDDDDDDEARAAEQRDRCVIVYSPRRRGADVGENRRTRADGGDVSERVGRCGD